MILVAGGDSFVWGSELRDEGAATPSNLTYSALVADALGYEYACLARPGNSNDAIARMTMVECDKLLAENKKISALRLLAIKQK